MRITVDTNVLVSAAVLDDLEQARRAAKLRRDAEIIAATVPALCEFAWVLMRGCRRATGEVISMIRSFLASAAVRVDRPATRLVLRWWPPAATSLMASSHSKAVGSAEWSSPSFDRTAVELIAATGGATRGKPAAGDKADSA